MSPHAPMIPNGSPRIAASDPSTAAGPDAPDNHPVSLEPPDDSAPGGAGTGSVTRAPAVDSTSAAMTAPTARAR